MALLRAEGVEFVPPERCLVGRSRGCDLVLTGRDVSGEHAVVQWNGARWEVRDLGSRNGTTVDGVRVAAGARVELRVGAVIGFGREAAGWVLAAGEAPVAMAVAAVGEGRVVSEGGYLALPGAEAPVLAVFQDAEGRWVAEGAEGLRAIADRALVEAGGLWRVHLPASCAGTWDDAAAPVLVASLRLRFTVSRDEEQVGLVAFAGERAIDLQVRAHHYPLLTLARRRLADRLAGLGAADEGWLRQDDLRTMLRLREDHLSISIHRARAQLGKAGVADAAAVIERRPGTRWVRIGVAGLEVVTEA